MLSKIAQVLQNFAKAAKFRQIWSHWTQIESVENWRKNYCLSKAVSYNCSVTRYGEISPFRQNYKVRLQQFCCN